MVVADLNAPPRADFFTFVLFYADTLNCAYPSSSDWSLRINDEEMATEERTAAADTIIAMFHYDHDYPCQLPVMKPERLVVTSRVALPTCEW